jgi:hypothetical protein
VREELVEPGLGGEYPPRRQRPGHFTQGILGPRQVEAGAEIDDQIERAVGEGELANIASNQLGFGMGCAKPLTG